MASVRQRVAFKSRDSDDEAGNQVLDEIEQEEVIKSIRHQNERSNKQSFFMLRAVMSLAIFLHIVALLQGHNPLDPFFARSAEARGESFQPSPPIPFGIVLTLLHITVLVDLALSDWLDFTWLFSMPPTTSGVAYGLTAVMPLVCIITRQGLPNVVWSCFAGLIVALDSFIRSMMSKGKENLNELEQSKYNAKGA